MATHYKTIGFVFKKNDINESDQIFSVFTKDFGRLELRVKAIRKITSKLRRDFDIFYFSEIEFIQGKNNKTLIDAVKIKKFDAGHSALNQISDILDNFIKGQEKDGRTFELLSEIFDKLNNKLAFQYFFWNFISLQGYHLEVQNCALCRGKLNPYNVYFSAKEGGIICRKCSAKDNVAAKVNSDIVKTLRLFLRRDWQTISKLKINFNSQNLLEDIFKKAQLAYCPIHC